MPPIELMLKDVVQKHNSSECYIRLISLNRIFSSYNYRFFITLNHNRFLFRQIFQNFFRILACTLFISSNIQDMSEYHEIKMSKTFTLDFVRGMACAIEVRTLKRVDNHYIH